MLFVYLSNMNNISFLDISYVLTAALGWAALGSWVLLLSDAVHPLAFSGARGFFIVVGFIFAGIRVKRGNNSSFTPREDRIIRWRSVILSGFAYGFASITYVMSLGLIPVGMAAPLHYTTPLFLICGTALVRRSLPAWNDFVGVILGASGAFILVLHASHGANYGVTFAIASAALWAVYLAAQGWLSPTEKRLAALTGGAVMFLFSVPWYHSGLATIPIVSLLAIAGIVSSSLPLALLARASKRLTPSSISLLLLCEPSLAALIAYLTTGQSIDTIKGLGLIFITAGAASPFFRRS
jgi:drug/metabolite transporter (DMT)-like permease